MWVLIDHFHRISDCKKTLLDYTDSFSTDDYHKNDKYGKINRNFDFRLKKNKWNKKLSFRKIKYNDLMSEKHKKVCRTFNYFENLLGFFSAVSGCVSISAFALLVGFTSPVVGLQICALTAVIKNQK